MTIIDAIAINAIHEGIALDLDNLVALRREIHREPEPGIANPLTCERILAAISELPLDVTIGSGEITSVVADLKRGASPCMRSRCPCCDARRSGTNFVFDAPPNQWPGAFHVSTRRGGGAKIMIEDGVESAYALHVVPNIPSGYLASTPRPFMASADGFEITTRGKGGHACTPHFAIDPIAAAAHVSTPNSTSVGGIRSPSIMLRRLPQSLTSPGERLVRVVT